MINLYTNAVNKNGFMGLVSKNETTTSTEQNLHSRKVASAFAIMSLAIMSIIAKGSEVVSYAASSAII